MGIGWSTSRTCSVCGCHRIAEGIAQLTGSATLPQDRRQGVQTALLARRLADAARTGCEIAVVVAQPGSRSKKNAQARGFEHLYTRAILLLTPAG